MQSQSNTLQWDFEPAISLLNTLSLARSDSTSSVPFKIETQDDANGYGGSGLGDFSNLWDYLGRPRTVENDPYVNPPKNLSAEPLVSELEATLTYKGVRWQDELDAADLEDNVEPETPLSAASRRTQKRTARRTRAKERAVKLGMLPVVSNTGTDGESGEELEYLRRSPDRSSIIAQIIGRPKGRVVDAGSPPTSPSPPKSELRVLKREPPISNPFLWPQNATLSPSHRLMIRPQGGLSARARKQSLISKLAARFLDERRFLSNSGLLEPAFTPLNKSNLGVHVFIDISNIMIGFHDCLKVERNIARETRIRRVPMSFHNFSLVLERGRPAAKRVLVGSDKFPIIQQAKSIGYETNILERVHKAKEATPRQKKYQSRGAAGSGLETSGSETITAPALEKWVEQAVDEILHLKILESLVDADKPGTIVLATGDAAEAEYSGGFMRMVERALEKGWMVELVSFKLNTSSAYKRREFRSKWGAMFKWVQLDDFVEHLVDVEEDEMA